MSSFTSKNIKYS